MKIIERGAAIAKCGRCGCVMEYDATDIRHKTVYKAQEYSSSHLVRPAQKEYVVCPQCGNNIGLARGAYKA